MPLKLSTAMRYQKAFLEHLELACKGTFPTTEVDVEFYVPLFNGRPLLVISLDDPAKDHCVSIDFYTHIQEGKYEVGIYRTQQARDRWLGTDLNCSENDYEFRIYTTTKTTCDPKDIDIANSVASAVRAVVGFLANGPYVKL